MSVDLYEYRFLWVLVMFIDREYEFENFYLGIMSSLADVA